MSSPDDDLVAGLASLGLSAEDARKVASGVPEGLSDEPTLALIGFDVTAVQAQVFASPRPVTIQGASEAIRKWDKNLAERLKERALVLFAGGGSATLVARANDERLEDDLRGWSRDRVPGAQCTTARVPFSPGELAGGPSSRGDAPRAAVRDRAGWTSEARGFGACTARLQAELRRNGGKERAHPSPHGAERAARCVECTSRARQVGERCLPCSRYRDAGAREKEHWDSARSYEDLLGPGGGQFAFIKLDGKGIGAVLDGLETMGQFRAVSKALHDAFEPELSQIELLGAPYDLKSNRDRDLLLQRTLAGGDDLMIVVPARWKRDPKAPPGAVTDALSLARALAERVEKVINGADLAKHFAPGSKAFEKVAKIGSGVGVVVTSGLPAHYCFDLAGDLVRSAKSILAGPGAPRSAVDFVVLHGGTMLSSSVEALREQETVRKGAPDSLSFGPDLSGDVRMTRRPYTLGEFADLLETARALPGERSALYGLGRAMRAPGPGMIHVRYQMARNRKLRDALLREKLLDELPRNLGDWILARGEDGTWATGIHDLLEVVRIVGPEVAAEEEGA